MSPIKEQGLGPVMVNYSIEEDDPAKNYCQLSLPEILEYLPINSLVRCSRCLAFADSIEKRLFSVHDLDGSCNGIVCINYFHEFISSALHEFKRLPFHNVREQLCPGFGVTSSGNDFKVILMCGQEDHHHPYVKAQFYSLRTNSWRQINDAPVSGLHARARRCVFLNTSSHWLEYKYSNPHTPWTVISFDMDSKIFREFELPDCLKLATAVTVIYNEGFGVVVDRITSSGLEFWAMKEDDIKESWTRMLVVHDTFTSTFLLRKNYMLMVNLPGFGLYQVCLRDAIYNVQLRSISLCTNRKKKYQVFDSVLISPIKGKVLDSVMIKEDELVTMKNCQLISLPDELVIEILECLPIKSLARFRCVAKSWCSLFKDPVFRKNHRGSKETMLLMGRRSNFPNGIDKGFFSFHDLDFPAMEVRPSLSYQFLRDLLGCHRSYQIFNLVGSCNGIVCIRCDSEFILCNPALHEFKRLPILKFVVSHTGFGVTSCGNDFKVIAIGAGFYVKESRRYLKAYLYSLRTNSWRQIDDAPGLNLYDCYCVFLKSSCHWIVYNFPNPRMVLCFDMDSEIFRELELPECLERASLAPVVLNECLGVVNKQLSRLELWVMKEYGITESWTRMFVLEDTLFSKAFLPWKNEMFMVHVHGLYYKMLLRPPVEIEEGQMLSISLHK